MAENEAMGFVETQGLVAAIEAADAMVKAARVRIKTVGNADAALISVICEGDLAACAAAVDAGKAAAARIGDLVGSNLIARPDDDTAWLVAERVDTIMPPRRGSDEKAQPKGKGGK
jgi:microcompartment protein CcmL/EutN